MNLLTALVSFEMKFCIENEMPSVRSPVFSSTSSIESLISERWAMSFMLMGIFIMEMSTIIEIRTPALRKRSLFPRKKAIVRITICPISEMTSTFFMPPILLANFAAKNMAKAPGIPGIIPYSTCMVPPESSSPKIL